jgi:hypothetical protein
MNRFVLMTAELLRQASCSTNVERECGKNVYQSHGSFNLKVKFICGFRVTKRD